MNAITTAIEVFESKIVEIRLTYRAKMGNTVDLKAIEVRDEELAQCLWAIETLHAAHIEQVEARNVSQQPVIGKEIEIFEIYRNF